MGLEPCSVSLPLQCVETHMWYCDCPYMLMREMKLKLIHIGPVDMKLSGEKLEKNQGDEI